MFLYPLERNSCGPTPTRCAGQRPSAPWQACCGQAFVFFLWKHIMSYRKAAVPANWLPVCDSQSPSQRQQGREYNLLQHALSIWMFSNKHTNAHWLHHHRTHFKLKSWKKTPNPHRQHWLQKEGNTFLPHNALKEADRAQWSFSVISMCHMAQIHETPVKGSVSTDVK